MKISIENFKSIGSLVNYEMRPLTILSGTNSSGKSSFIQLLLLLQQTLEIDSTQRPLYLDGKLFPVRSYFDIIKNKDKDNKLKVKFIFNKSELERYKHYPELSIYDLNSASVKNLTGEDLQISQYTPPTFNKLNNNQKEVVLEIFEMLEEDLDFEISEFIKKRIIEKYN